MSGPPGASEDAPSNAPARPAASTHRFQDRRQQRMRGAGTHTAIQKDFQFKLPPRKLAPPPAQAQASASNATAPATQKSSRTPSSASSSRSLSRKTRAATDDSNASAASSSTDSIASRRSRRYPVSSTPAASRRASSISQVGLALGRSQSRRDESLQEIRSQASSDVDDDAGAATLASPALAEAGGTFAPDLSIPAIPSPPSSASRLEASAGRNTSVSHRSDLEDSLVQLGPNDSLVSQDGGAEVLESPAATAVKRGQEARKRRRQASPGGESERRAAAAFQSSKKAKTHAIPPSAVATGASQDKDKGKAREQDPERDQNKVKGKGKAKAKPARVTFEAPAEADMSDLDADMTYQDRRPRLGRLSVLGSVGPLTKPQQKQLEKRLRRALSLVVPKSYLIDGGEGETAAAGGATAVPRKSRRLLNDVDVVWATLDDELKQTVEAQPNKRVVAALKAVRRRVREACQGLSEQTDRRSRAILDLVRARKRKREVRRAVWQARRKVVASSQEEKQREGEVKRWKRENEDVHQIQTFLSDIQRASSAWT
ncbi:hypothetical protein ACQY0O_007999 [Thecaphora frezii]